MAHWHISTLFLTSVVIQASFLAIPGFCVPSPVVIMGEVGGGRVWELLGVPLTVVLILPAEIGCEVGLQEGKHGVAHLVSQHGPIPRRRMGREGSVEGWGIDDGEGDEERRVTRTSRGLSSRCSVASTHSVYVS